MMMVGGIPEAMCDVADRQDQGFQHQRDCRKHREGNRDTAFDGNDPSAPVLNGKTEIDASDQRKKDRSDAVRQTRRQDKMKWQREQPKHSCSCERALRNINHHSHIAGISGSARFAHLLLTVIFIGFIFAKPSFADISERLEEGAILYSENCASCHGGNLEGAEDWRGYQPDGTLKPPPHDVSGHTWHHTDEQLFTYTKLGGAGAMADMPDFKSGMPAFEDVLSDEQIRTVLDYIKSTWPEKIREAQEEISNEDREARIRKWNERAKARNAEAE